MKKRLSKKAEEEEEEEEGGMRTLVGQRDGKLIGGGGLVPCGSVGGGVRRGDRQSRNIIKVIRRPLRRWPLCL